MVTCAYPPLLTKVAISFTSVTKITILFSIYLLTPITKMTCLHIPTYSCNQDGCCLHITAHSCNQEDCCFHIPTPFYNLHVSTDSYNQDDSSLLKPEHYRQCTYNVTLRHVCITIVAVEKQEVLHILSVCL